MKKDKEWLKKEIGKSILSSGFDKLSLDMNIMEFEYLLDQLDEPEVLSQDWINEHAVEGDFRGEQQFWYGRFIEEEKVRNLLVPKQDELEQTDTNVGLSKVVIPHFVADYYNDYKNQELTFEEWFESPPLNKGSHTENETFKWFLNNEHETNLERQFILADIIVHGLDGYEVEKEKLYRIKFSDNQYASRFNNEKISSTLTDEELAAQYTESEIKAIDKRFWVFAEEVTQ